MTGLVSLGMVAAMLPSLACALNQEPEMVLPFLGTILIGFGFGAYALRTTVSQRKMRLSIRGGAVFLGLSWLYTSLLGAVFRISLRAIFPYQRHCLKAPLR